MQCRRCGFQNMPDQARCGRCRSVLSGAVRVDVYPPRAGWTKRWRPAQRWACRLAGSPFRAALKRIGRPLSPALSCEGTLFLAALLSVVPGLGHLVTRRLTRVKWLWAAWCACMLVGLMLYGSAAGGICLGLGISVHAWMICDAGALQEMTSNRLLRLALPAVVFVLLLVAPYSGVRRLAGRFVRGAYISADIQPDGISSGDFLLVRLRAPADGPPQRGDVVLYEIPSLHIAGYLVRGSEALGKVIGLPGDRVQVSAGEAVVSTPGGTSYVFPAREQFEDAQFATDVPHDRFFCVMAGSLWHSNRLAPRSLPEFVKTIALTPWGSVKGRAFMVWNPIYRRGPLRRSLPEPSWKDANEPL